MPHAIGFACALALASLLGGCTIDGVAIMPGPDANDFGDESDGGDADDTESNDSSNHDDDADDGDDLLDLPSEGESDLLQACNVLDGELDAALPCGVEPPSDQLAPVVAWTWTGPDGEDSVLVTPLVGNLDDDTYDDAINPCDRPEVIVLAVNAPASKEIDAPGHLYVLDSETGETKWRIDRPVDATTTPALADLDDDGVPEILAFERSEEMIGQAGSRRVVAFRADGKLAWVSDTWVESQGGGGLAIADLDADGSPEILAPEHVLSADGLLLWAPPAAPMSDSLPVAADLDADGKLEVLFGRSIYAHDGTELFELSLPGNKNSGVSAIANFDDDEEPEIYLHRGKHRVFEHDGTPKVECADGNGNGNGNDKDQPITIIDTNDDGRAEILSNYHGWFQARTIVTKPDGKSACEELWSVKISDGSGSAFDFLADGSAEAIYMDVGWVRIFDTSGDVIFQEDRVARPSMANPVVADADNDGAAELIVVGSKPEDGEPEVGSRVSVLFIENADDRFAPTRRIWNQHAYHATNVREDARIPVEQEPYWNGPNSFRINPAPSYSGDACQMPVIE